MLNRLKALRTNENVLLAVDTLLHSKSVFLSTFLMTFMIRTSIDNSPIEFIAYRLLSFVGTAVLAIVLLQFVRKHALIAWRLGMLFSIIRVLVIITLYTQTAIFPYVLALVVAIESTLYWRPGAFFMITEVRNDRRLRFQSIRQILTNASTIIMPFFLGLFITEAGFITAAFIILGISVVQFLLSILFRPSRDVVYPAHHASVTFRKIINSQPLRRILYLQFFRGLIVSGSAFLIIVPLLVYNFTNSDLDLGLFASIGAIISIAVIIIFHRISRHKRASRIFLWILAPLAVVFSVALALFPSSLTAIILYIYTIAIIESFFEMFVMGRVQRSIKKQLSGHSFTLEIESVSEVFLNIGRVISLTILLFFITNSGTTYLPIFIAVNAIFMIPVVLLSKSKKVFPIEEPIP
ncbi:MFS transporter [Candidatus Saccharibacteria bacterium]|nr:MFS transporter [Candidatus Saccharibacteria bacterium]